MPTMNKKTANYRPAANRDKRCGNCAMFRSKLGETARCTLVRGEIDPDYTCDHWEKKR